MEGSFALDEKNRGRKQADVRGERGQIFEADRFARRLGVRQKTEEL